MKNRGLRTVHLFFTSLVIFLLHIPFSFSRTKPVPGTGKNARPRPAVVGDAPLSGLPPVEEKPAYAVLYDSLKLASMGLAKQVFNYAMSGYEMLKEAGRITNDQVISIVDFSRSSSEKRLFIIDLKSVRVLFNTYVAHGMNSGQEYARQFSNQPESNRSSLGFYATAATYRGKHGQSLQLVGLEKGINDQAFNRSIVVHGASYVSEAMIRAKGFIGRSHGCPAVPEQLSKPIIEQIKNGSLLFIYGPDPLYASRTAMNRQAVSGIAG